MWWTMTLFCVTEVSNHRDWQYIQILIFEALATCAGEGEAAGGLLCYYSELKNAELVWDGIPLNGSPLFKLLNC
jgi:hypothetical protein